METGKSKKIFNIVMIAAIVLIAAIGVIVIGDIKGWFSSSENSFATMKNSVGAVNIIRSGVSFGVKKDTALQNDDKIKVEKNSAATIDAGKNTYVLNENSNVVINSVDDNSLSLNMNYGEMFVTVNDSKAIKSIAVNGWILTIKNAAFSISAQKGSINVYVLDGSLQGKNEKNSISADKGNVISIVGDKVETTKLTIESLNDFNLKNAKKVNESRHLCFTNDEIDKLINMRKAEAGKDGNAVLTVDGEIVSNIGETKQSGETIKYNENKTTSKSDSTVSTTKSSSISSGVNNSATTTKSSGSKTTTKKQVNTSKVLHCTVQIRCDTILSNMQNLKTGKEESVPDDGVILPATRVEFYDSESAYDVLYRVCKAYKIQIEASYTPMYDSYYVEGINNLYERDCGEQSGWTYKVNGWFPNYGCSSYYLKDGDTMVWCYTCNGYGADVGCEMS